MTDDEKERIRDRIRELRRGPKKIEVQLIWDDEQALWLADVPWALLDTEKGAVAAGRTIKEVLARIAEEIER